MRAKRVTPASLMTLKIVVDAIKEIAMTTWTATTAAINPKLWEGVFICCTKIIVATIAPGPANKGVPNGTKAMFLSLEPSPPMSRPVRSSSDTYRRSNPPAACNASIETFM